jgi:hypothetical protein
MSHNPNKKRIRANVGTARAVPATNSNTDRKNKMKTETTNEEALIPLAEALRMLKNDPLTAWMPHSSIRAAVAKGRVFSRRSPAGKFSRYYVRLSDLKKLFEPTAAVE